MCATMNECVCCVRESVCVCVCGCLRSVCIDIVAGWPTKSPRVVKFTNWLCLVLACRNIVRAHIRRPHWSAMASCPFLSKPRYLPVISPLSTTVHPIRFPIRRGFFMQKTRSYNIPVHTKSIFLGLFRMKGLIWSPYDIYT